MPLSRANSIGPGPGPGSRDPLFQTLLTPRGSRPSTPSFSPSAGTPRPRRNWHFVAVNAVLIATSSILLLLTAAMYLPDSDLYYWKRDGCQTKILDMNGRAAQSSGLVAVDIGHPTDRQPRTAIVNTVRFHTEIVASLIYHFTKLNHNVTVYARDDGLGIERVINPFHWKGIKRYEHFYNTFYEFDTIVFATYPTCHLELAANLIATGLPQRYLAVLHNPDLLAADEAAAAMVAAQGNVQLLTITPHVNEYANSILEAEGFDESVRSQWFAPIFPVLFPEDCSNPSLKSPSGIAAEQPACDRSAVWQDIDGAAPVDTNLLTNSGGAGVDETEDEDSDGWNSRSGKRRKLAAKDLKATISKKKNSSKDNTSDVDGEIEVQPPRVSKGFFSTRGGGEGTTSANGNPGSTSSSTSFLSSHLSRQGFCVQGKLDPSRRSYDSLFSDLAARREALLASDFSLVLQGKMGGRSGKDILEVPSELEEDGLVRRYTALPFQEFYEVLHSCLAIMPAFASEAYYLHKGSSSIAASFIAGTPLIATPRALAAYSFLDSSSVFLVPEGTKDVDAMEAVMALPSEVIEAKLAAMRSLRHQLYERNFALLQSALGEQYLAKKKVSPSNTSASGKKKKKNGSVYNTMWYDASGPLWTA
ncbi:hypothetical protein Ndes2526B_g00880 [Nannochloris sp. 'desiccata']|nr:hypothetical protein NADE_008473 [Chlorella desiccata (nom. nud.)]